METENKELTFQIISWIPGLRPSFFFASFSLMAIWECALSSSQSVPDALDFFQRKEDYLQKNLSQLSATINTKRQNLQGLRFNPFIHSFIHSFTFPFSTSYHTPRGVKRELCVWTQSYLLVLFLSSQCSWRWCKPSSLRSRCNLRSTSSKLKCHENENTEGSNRHHQHLFDLDLPPVVKGDFSRGYEELVTTATLRMWRFVHVDFPNWSNWFVSQIGTRPPPSRLSKALFFPLLFSWNQTEKMRSLKKHLIL